MDTRTCRGCGKELPADTKHFYKSIDKPQGLSYNCKPCHNARSKVYGDAYRKRAGKSCSKSHRKIYESFHGPIEPGMVIHHIDNDPSNNHISNLTKVTNLEHKRIHAGWEHMVDGWWKPCSACKKLLSVTEFSEHIKGSGRYQSKCKRCANRYPERICPVCDQKYTPCYQAQKTCSQQCSGIMRANR